MLISLSKNHGAIRLRPEEKAVKNGNLITRERTSIELIKIFIVPLGHLGLLIQRAKAISRTVKDVILLDNNLPGRI